MALVQQNFASTMIEIHLEISTDTILKCATNSPSSFQILQFSAVSISPLAAKRLLELLSGSVNTLPSSSSRSLASSIGRKSTSLCHS